MASNVLELSFSCKNRLVEMGRYSEFRVISISGLEASEYTINSINSNQDGAIVTHRKIEPREIVIVGDVKKNVNEDLNRQMLISFFNPKFDGELRVNRNGNEKKISYVVSSFRFMNTKMNEWLQFEIVLDCPNPYFESIDDFGNNIASVSKQFTFPLAILPQRGGKIMGYKTFNNDVILDNDGDCETGCEIRIKANGGKVVNPKILLNDKFIAVNVSVGNNEVLKMNTNQRKKSITLNGKNVVQMIDRRSTFFNLEVGTNVLKYESSEGYAYMEVYVYFYKKYLGV